jgi:antitoxin component YwqK of YwqJK toxin-antitoxin module
MDSLGKGKEQGVGYEFSDDDGRITAVVQYRNGYIAGRERINRKDKFNQKQGLWRYFYPSMVTKEEGRFKNDKKHGYWKTFDEEGNLLETLKYEDGILIPEPEELAKLDIKREYHPNAQVKSVGSYNKGVKEGVHREYSMEGQVTGAKIYSKGKVIGEGIVDAEGRRQGPWKEFYDSGELRSEGSYKKGLREGEWVFYYKDGKEEQRGTYFKGKPDGDWKWTYNNGQTWREESFIEGLEEGLAIEYNDTGKVVSKGNYLSGEREGEWIIDLGDHREEGSYVAGLQQGMWKSYYPSGKVKNEGKFEQGRESGKHTEYYENGQIREVGVFKFGSQEGDWFYYDVDGIQTRVITYKQGIPVKIDGEKVPEVTSDDE